MILDAMLAKGFASSHGGAGIRIGHDPMIRGAIAIGANASRPWTDEALPHFASAIAALSADDFRGKLAMVPTDASFGQCRRFGGAGTGARSFSPPPLPICARSKRKAISPMRHAT